jgi:PDZ domain
MPQRLVLIAGLVLIPLSPVSADDFMPTREEIPKLIEKLGSPRFTERETATRRLALLDDIPPELQAAAKAADAEVSRRAKSIIALITKRHEKEIIARELAAINRMGFDRYVDRMVLTPGFATEQRWKALVRAAEVVLDRANKLGHAGTPLPQVRWAELPLITELPPRYVQSSRVLVDGHSDRFSGFRGCVALSSASIDRFTQIRDSIVIINGDMPRLTSVWNSLVICTGDVGPVSNLRGSVILATGQFDGASSPHGSLVQARKMSRAPSGDANVYVNMGKAPDGDSNRYVQTVDSPLAALKMFVPEMLGAAIKVDKSEATVESVSEKSPLAAAGLRQGDVLLSVGQDKWSTEDEFRVLLRKKSAHPTMGLTVRRGGKELTLSAKFDE